MRTTLEPEEIDAIARATAALLKPLLAASRDREDTIYDINGLAEYLAVTVKWIYDNKRSIPCYKLQGQLRFKKSEIDAWMSKNRVPATGEFPGKLK